ncbi:MAG: capsular polysaccharide biosynthesis protein [Pseudomonadales bacterium]|jgi:capsular polysaccharide biosynthesis protein
MRLEIDEESESYSFDSELMTEDVESSEAPSEISLAGGDGWLFSKHAADLLHEKSDDTEQKIELWRHELISREAHFFTKGIRYFHVCIPDKLTIHGEILSREASPYPAIDQFSPLQMLSVHKSKLACLIDPSGYLRRQADKYPLYWKSDTRWSPWSAYMTCQLLCSSLKDEINNLLLGYPFDESNQMMNLDGNCWPNDPEQIRTYRFWLRSKRRFANDLVKLRETAVTRIDPLLSQAEYGEGAHVVFESHHEKTPNRSLIIFGDEHSAETRTLLTGMLAETYSEVHFVWGAGIDYAYVESVQPNVVITQGSELQLLDNPVTSINMRELAERSMQNLQRVLNAGDCGDGKESATEPVPYAEPAKTKGIASSKVILPSERYVLDAPVLVQPHGICSKAETTMVSNDVILHEISEAQIFFNGPALWVHDNNDQEILRDNVPETRKRPGRWRRGKRLKGTTLLFATSAGAHCYYHWMLEILPKLGMLEREGIPLDSIDHFLVREISAKWQLETLTRFGIDKSRIVETARKPHWRCDKLLHIDLNCGINLKMHRFIPQWMKHLYPPVVENKPRIKLYITRPSGVRRGIANEHEILPLLEEAGFTIMAMEGLSVADQAALLARVDVLMSPHGGALTNMVFCKPGITVVEMFSRHVFPYYYGLAANCGHHYHAILENPEQDYPRLVNSAAAQSFADSQHETAGLSFDVSVDAIRAVLKIV